jgi:probable F420-dependent oxidoreductase
MAKYTVGVGMFGVQDLCGGDTGALIDVAQMADESGVTQLNFTDHVIMSENTGVYPFGDFPVPPEYPWFEPLTLMSVIAGATKRIRLGTGVLIAPLRPAVLLAKIVATLDVFSKGRLDLGIGTGWQKEEYIACAVPFENRMQRLDDCVRTMRLLWSKAPASHKSDTVNFERMYSVPAPVQKGGVPLWYGLKANEENAARIAEFGSGWIPIQSRPEFISSGVQILSEAFSARGRDPKELQVRALAPLALDSKGQACLDKAPEVIAPLLEAGATHIEFMPYMYVQKKADFEGFFKTISEQVKL